MLGQYFCQQGKIINKMLKEQTYGIQRIVTGTFIYFFSA